MWLVTIEQRQPREGYTLTDTIRAEFQIVENAKLFADLALEHAKDVSVTIEWSGQNYGETKDAEE